MSWILEHYDNIFSIIGAAVTFASTIVALTPTTKDDELLGKIITLLEHLSIFNKRRS